MSRKLSVCQTCPQLFENVDELYKKIWWCKISKDKRLLDLVKFANQELPRYCKCSREQKQDRAFRSFSICNKCSKLCQTSDSNEFYCQVGDENHVSGKQTKSMKLHTFWNKKEFKLQSVPEECEMRLEYLTKFQKL